MVKRFMTAYTVPLVFFILWLNIVDLNNWWKWPRDSWQRIPFHLFFLFCDWRYLTLIIDANGQNIYDCIWLPLYLLFILWLDSFILDLALSLYAQHHYSPYWSNVSRFPTRGSLKDVVYLYGWPIASSDMSPNTGGGGIAGSQPMSTDVYLEPK